MAALCTHAGVFIKIVISIDLTDGFTPDFTTSNN